MNKFRGHWLAYEIKSIQLINRKKKKKKTNMKLILQRFTQLTQGHSTLKTSHTLVITPSPKLPILTPTSHPHLPGPTYMAHIHPTSHP